MTSAIADNATRTSLDRALRAVQRRARTGWAQTVRELSSGATRCHAGAAVRAAVDLLSGLRSGLSAGVRAFGLRYPRGASRGPRRARGQYLGARIGGRPVIDAVVIATVDTQPAIIAALLAVGFTHSPFAWIEPTLTTSLRVEGVSYSVLLYVLDEKHPVVRGWLATREHWRAHPDETDRYAQVKRAALADGHVQPWTYQQAKTPYLEQLVRQLSRTDGSKGFPPED
jgi:GrpB protein